MSVSPHHLLSLGPGLATLALAGCNEESCLGPLRPDHLLPSPGRPAFPPPPYPPGATLSLMRA